MNTSELRDYYGLLGVPQSATVSDIHKAYWQQASHCHPDKGGSHEKMVQLVEAWKILSDPVKRARYDQLLRYRHGDWRSRKFSHDVQDARKRAHSHSVKSWEEFEKIYQKAFYTFNQDFYGDDIEAKATGPYSPLMNSNSIRVLDERTSKNKPIINRSHANVVKALTYILKTFLLLVTVIAVVVLYQNHSGVGRFVSLKQDDSSHVLIMDTTNGSVYSVEKKDGALPLPWKEIVLPSSQDKK
jgi:curved DNA-binding protein CbpA